jgi:hypothetical protein
MENFAKNHWGSSNYSTLLKKLRTVAISDEVFDDLFWRTMVRKPRNCSNIQKGCLFWFLITTQHW